MSVAASTLSSSAAVAALTVLLAAPAAHAADPESTFSSGSQRVSLVELYTSEGCSSCPPADRWLSSLARREGLWRDFVPVALHVDYWDDIGWPDRFARPEYGDRQRRYAREMRKPVVYTPGLFVDGREWLGWRQQQDPPHNDETAGVLTLRLRGNGIDVEYRANRPIRETLRVHLGLVGMQVETDVRAGENRGRRLRHDFVLLHLDRIELRVNEDGQSAVARLPRVETEPAADAIVAWVSTDRRQAPLQATGGFLAAPMPCGVPACGTFQKSSG